MAPLDEPAKAASPNAIASDALAQSKPSDATGFGFYLFLHGAWFLIFGVQVVLFPYLVRVVLEESEGRLGLAQMTLQLPTTVFILFGGFIADRIGGRKLILALYTSAIFPFLILGVLVGNGALSYGLIIGYALVVGSIGAFALPARDALLSQVAPQTDGSGIQKAVSFASLAQFVGQIAGMALAAAATLIGVTGLLFLQAGLMGLATLSGFGLRPRAHTHKSERGEMGPLRFMASEIAGGLRAVTASPVIGPVTLLAIAIGVCFMGAFMVLLPLMVQSYFPSDLSGDERAQVASALGLFSLCFWVGTILTAGLLVRMGPPRHKGRAVLLALGLGATVLLATSFHMPFWALCFLNFLWGIGGGVGMTVSRGIVQEAAPPAIRGRVLSVYMLGFMGGAPIGAVTYGYLAGALGPHTAILIPGTLMLACVTGVAVFSKLWNLTEVTAEA